MSGPLAQGLQPEGLAMVWVQDPAKLEDIKVLELRCSLVAGSLPEGMTVVRVR